MYGCLCFLLVIGTVAADSYVLDDTDGLGRVFDGFGGLSGGGATSRLLVSYPEKQRDEILDYLFLPNFGASLHILKVEIGGDAQSTDGTESSHMHEEDDENYQRGYEWWLMTEAKKRNPKIKLYGLSWAFPAWVGNGSGSPYKYPNLTAGYIVKWIKGAKTQYDLDIDYVGIWNERSYDSTYIKTLRMALDAASLNSVQIVAADGSFGKIATEVLNDPDLSKAVSILGAHYPGTKSTDDAMKSGKQLWASEDYSTYNDDTGAGCWARILNQNYVTGHMTSTISWNLIASYYPGLPFFRDGLMTAVEPWSGHYDLNGPIWVSGIHYLAHGKGVGFLAGGGSYVTFFDSTTNDFTIVIETMSHDHSVCIRPSLPKYDVKPQNATFQLKGNLKATSLNQWVSQVNASDYFQQKQAIPVSGGEFTIDLPVDSVVTLSTMKGQPRPPDKDIPNSEPFPTQYQDDFESYSPYSEASYFADQTGVFEIAAETGKDNKVMQQVVKSRPITWCNDAASPITIIGNISWVSMNFSIMAKLDTENTSIFIAGGVSKGGCGIASATGIFASVNGNGNYMVTSDLAMKDVLTSGKVDVKMNEWFKLSMAIDGSQSKKATMMLNTVPVTVSLPSGYSSGYIGVGTGGFYSAEFDNIVISSASYG